MVTEARNLVAGNARVAKRSGTRRPWAAIALFLGPPMLYYAIFVLYPLVATFYYSFHNIAPSRGQVVTTFVGFDNFRQLMSDDVFHRSVRNTLIWGIVGPAIELLTATVLAFLIYFKVPFHRFYRVAWFTPMLVSGVIVGLVFRWIFNYDWGLLNVTLRAIGLDALALNWLGRTDTPLIAVILTHYWSTFGYTFILLLAGLSAIPDELLDAAYVDGSSKVRAALLILLPLLRPTVVTALVLSFIGKMRAFEVVWALTEGGPLHASETVATYVQKRAFGWQGSLDLGYPAAMAVVWFGVVLVGVVTINRRLRSRFEY
jgi:multiple sugar transport system permease protein/raffinose/stachyose/melibiose transport system permease protein